MAWTHYKILRRQSQEVFLLHYAGQADASDLSDYVLFDISAEAPARTKTQLDYLRIKAGFFTVLEWDATTDDFIAACPDGGEYLFPPPFDRAELVSGNMLIDPVSTGTTGDIVMTTVGGAAGKGVVIDAIIKVI